MKKIILIILSIICVSFANNISINLNSNQIELNKIEKEYLKSKTSLKTQVEENYYPYLYLKNNKPEGYVVDIINLISLKLNKPIEFVPTISKKDAVALMKDNKLDFVSGYVYSKKRLKDYLYSKDFLMKAHIGLISSNEKPIDNFNQMENKKIAVVEGYHLVDLLKKHHPKVKIYLVKNNLEVIKAILNKKVDAGISNYNVLDFLVSKNGYNTLLYNKILNTKHFYTKNQHFVFKKDDEILKSIIDKAYASINESVKKNLRDKWFKNEIQIKKSPLQTYLNMISKTKQTIAYYI